jgi:hypothetical protein
LTKIQLEFLLGFGFPFYIRQALNPANRLSSLELIQVRIVLMFGLECDANAADEIVQVLAQA